MAERKSDDDENGDVDCGDERALFVHYFRKGYSQNEMIRFLSEFHGIEIRLSILYMYMKAVKRKQFKKKAGINYDMATLGRRI